MVFYQPTPLYIVLLAPSLVARYYLRPALYFRTYPPGFQTGFCAVNTRWRLLKGNFFKELPCPEPSWELWCNVEKALIKSMHLTCIFLRTRFFYQSAFSPFHSIQWMALMCFLSLRSKSQDRWLNITNHIKDLYVNLSDRIVRLNLPWPNMNVLWTLDQI